MSLQDAARLCLQQKYADFSGRGRRSEYWNFVLFYVLAVVAVAILSVILNAIHLGIIGTLLYAVVVLGLVVPLLAAGARRLHDTGKSGWLLLLGLIPVVSLVLLVFFVQDSSPEANQYGPSPKAVTA